MSNQVTLFEQEGAGLSTKFQAMVLAGQGTELGEGIRGSYGIISIKSGRFRIKYKGQETMLTAGGNPVANIDVVIVKANAYLNKQYYAGKYVEGSNSPPDCYSLDGKAPSAAVQNPQHSNCELCPKNQWGSLIGENGQKQKACRDTKKLAIVPVADIKNISFGGAMLFRVPPSSLKDLSTMADNLKGRGYPYNSVAVRIGFDMDASHPKPTFKAIRPLTDAEADQVLEMYASDSVERVLADTEIVPEGTAAAPRVQPVVQAQAAPPLAPLATPFPPAPAAPTAFAGQEGPTVLIPTPVPAGPAAVIQPFNPGAAPPPLDMSIFAPAAAPAPVPQSAPVAPAVPASVAPRAPVAPPTVAAPAAPAAAEPQPNALEADIGQILAGLSQFTGSK